MWKFTAPAVLALILGIGATEAATGAVVQHLPNGTVVTTVAHSRQSRRVTVQRRYYYNSPRYVVRRRSHKKALGIVGGGAAGGALIGGIAGGPAGAGVGALVGGGGSFVYERLTHKKVRQY